jgi:hypothetical protein
MGSFFDWTETVSAAQRVKTLRRSAEFLRRSMDEFLPGGDLLKWAYPSSRQDSTIQAGYYLLNVH